MIKLDYNIILIILVLLYFFSNKQEMFNNTEKFESLDNVYQLAEKLNLKLRGILYQNYVKIEFYLLELKISTDKPNAFLYKYFTIQKGNDQFDIDETSYRAVYDLPIRKRIEDGDVISIKDSSAWYSPWIFREYDF